MSEKTSEIFLNAHRLYNSLNHELHFFSEHFCFWNGHTHKLKQRKNTSNSGRKDKRHVRVRSSIITTVMGLCISLVKRKYSPSLSLHGFGLSEPTEDKLPLAFPEFSWLVTSGTTEKEVKYEYKHFKMRILIFSTKKKCLINAEGEINKADFFYIGFGGIGWTKTNVLCAIENEFCANKRIFQNQFQTKYKNETQIANTKKVQTSKSCCRETYLQICMQFVYQIYWIVVNKMGGSVILVYLV